MDVESGVQLAASGNTRGVEEQWMTALDRHAGNPGEVATWATLLDELAKRERYAEAEPLAWAAVEAVQERCGAEAAVQVASAFLLALHKSNDLKSQVAELYRTAYADRPGIDALIEEAGVAGGRPPRRALRTMDVGLRLRPGIFVVGRNEEKVGRVESIDPQTWEVSVSSREGKKTYGPVELADEFIPVPADDFRVLRHYDASRLQAMLADDPASVVINILKAHSGKIDSDALQAVLVPQLIPQKDWSKWWTRARTALKRHPNVGIEGRSPYELSYSEESVSLESSTEATFKKLTDPLEQLGTVEDYLRECKTAKTEPDQAMLTRLRAAIEKTCHRQMKAHSPATLGSLLVLRNMALLLGATKDEVDRTVIDFLRKTPDLAPCLHALPSETLWPVACDYVRVAHPETYAKFYEDLLPEAPAGVCDLLARGLLDSGMTAAHFEPIVQRVLKDATRCVNALVWLWKGPDPELNIPCPPLSTLCSRLLWAAGEIRRDHEVPRELKKRVQHGVRAAFTGENYAHFKRCLSEGDAALAASWRTLIGRLDNMGRAIPEDLLNLIRTAFPELYKTAQISPWKREDVLYVTSAGRRKFEAELDDLVNVKMRANAIAIGEAASHGDLSENSEYKFALEERDLLRARMGQMQEQLNMAEVLKPDEVRVEEVGFGTRVTLRNNQTGMPRQIAFLGPWEAQIDRGIYNYKSPLAQLIMGAAAGETVDLPMFEPPGAYTVEKIENALIAVSGE